MNSHGVNELLLQQEDDSWGGWKLFDDMDPNDIEYEVTDECRYRLVRLGIIDGKLMMRKQYLDVSFSGSEYLPEKEETDWCDISVYTSLGFSIFLLDYLNEKEEIWDYTLNNSHLLVLK